MLVPCMGWSHNNLLKYVECGGQINPKQLVGQEIYQFINFHTVCVVQ
jgi:hypothetical protein